MHLESILQKVDSYKTIYAELKEKLRWKVTDQRTLMIVASLYVVKDRPFEIQRFLEISDYIKQQVSVFSSLRTERFTMAAMLDTRFDDPKEKLNALVELYDRLIEGGFGKGNFTYMAALIMLAEYGKEGLYTDAIKRALAIYQGMKKNHIFLTSKSDYPLAVLLSQLNGEVEDVMARVEEFYDKLAMSGFRKGNDLQFLSHILSVDKETETYVLVERCIQIYELFAQHIRKPKAMHYPEIGLLALLENGAGEVETIQHVLKKLNSEKLFKWHKDLNVIMAVNFTVSDQMKNSSLMETGIYTTIEAIIQAQQAAMIAVIASTSAATSSGNGGS
ncbi:DUF4003 family protein [Fictibacillus gelatini]|uniref:DUF4003 family protein n=1 Tax=Fictibacillus gelatini TaxID=225985 RepID=UPI00040648F8|nr:DUF4003 family protein [Fictibacillus gelatini]